LLAPEDLKLMAQQYRAGDKGVLVNLGRGTQGAQNIVLLRHEIGNQMREEGATGADIAAKMAEFAGLTAAQRTVGTRTANVELAANEADKMTKIALDASKEVVRSGLLPFGKAQVMFDNQTNNPALRSFAMANNSLVNVYARAISPQGVPTISDKEHARELLSTAHDQKSYEATVEMMRNEIKAARAAPPEVRSAFSQAISGRKQTPEPSGKTVVKTGTYGGKKVIQYSDGSIDYAPD
jgi:hypothetical protein